MNRLAPLLWLAVSAAATAQEGQAPAPLIREIAFEGNDTTRPRTLERELIVHVGDPADPQAIERSRQAVQDLGLFRDVHVEQRPMPGGVLLVFKVREKFFFIPAPRADTNSDGQYAYGAQLRWYNVLGYNHTAKFVIKKTNRQEAGRGTALEFDGSYLAPFFLDTPFGLDLSYSHNREPVDDVVPGYDQLTQSIRTVVFRSFQEPNEPASHGYRVGGGLQWVSSINEGAGAPPSDGRATALVLNAGYNNRRFNIYSETGRSWNLEWQGASARLGSDYDFTSLTGHYDSSWALGDTPYQTVAAFIEGGIHDGGPPNAPGAFELGGVSDLRGYARGLVRGETYWYGGVEALRPLFTEWLRGVVFVEAGDAFPEHQNFALEESFADVGIGLRVRVIWFVRFELNVGYAYPLRKVPGSETGRIFATGRR